MKCTHLHLASFIQHKVFEVHPCCNMWQQFIPLCCQIIFHCMVYQIYLFTSGWTFGCYHFLVIMNNVAINIHIQVFAWTDVFISLGQILRDRIPGSCGRFMFSFLRNFPNIFQSIYTIVHSHQQCMTVPVFLRSLNYGDAVSGFML